jgi:FixJ family two-component response regulator
MKAAALEFLSKPINDEDLLDAIQQTIARDHRVDEDSWVDDRAWVDILRPYRFDHLLAQDQKRRQKASDSLPASVILPTQQRAVSQCRQAVSELVSLPRSASRVPEDKFR